MTARPPIARHGGRFAFTLLELSIVVIIMALIAGGALRYASSVTNANNYATTNARLDAIEAALMNFRVANNRLPCPADILQPENSSSFGEETETLADGLCTGFDYNNAYMEYANTGIAELTSPGGYQSFASANLDPYYSTPNPDASYDPMSYGNIVGGALPTKALKLPDSYAYDAWGRKFIYAVDRRFTITNTFAMYSVINPETLNGGTPAVTSCPSGSTCTAGAIVIFPKCTTSYYCNTSISNSLSYAAAYALVSLGQDGMGGHVRNLNSTPVIYTASNINPSEWQNCHCYYSSGSFFYGPFFRYFVQAPISNSSSTDLASGSFNQVVRYKTRAQLAVSQEMQ